MPGPHPPSINAPSTAAKHARRHKPTLLTTHCAGQPSTALALPSQQPAKHGPGSPSPPPLRCARWRSSPAPTARGHPATWPPAGPSSSVNTRAHKAAPALPAHSPSTVRTLPRARSAVANNGSCPTVLRLRPLPAPVPAGPLLTKEAPPRHPPSPSTCAVLPSSESPLSPSKSPITPSTTATSASAVWRWNDCATCSRLSSQPSRLMDGRPVASLWCSGSMKSADQRERGNSQSGGQLSAKCHRAAAACSRRHCLLGNNLAASQPASCAHLAPL